MGYAEPAAAFLTDAKIQMAWSLVLTSVLRSLGVSAQRAAGYHTVSLAVELRKHSVHPGACPSAESGAAEEIEGLTSLTPRSANWCYPSAEQAPGV